MAAAGFRPPGCGTVVTFVFFASLFPDFLASVTPYFALLLSVGVGVLMVSRVRYFSFKEYDFLRAHPVRTMVTFLFLLALVVSLPRLFGFLLCAIYIAGGLAYTFVILPRRNRQLLRALSPQSD